MDIRKLLAKTSTVKFTIYDEDVEVTYKVGAYTASKRIEFFENEEMTLYDIAEWLIEEAVVSWSLTDGKQPFDITVENLNLLPTQFHGALMRAIQNDTGVVDEGE